MTEKRLRRLRDRIGPRPVTRICVGLVLLLLLWSLPVGVVLLTPPAFPNFGALMAVLAVAAILWPGLLVIYVFLSAEEEKR